MDEDAAAAAGQLFGSGPSGVLVIDGNELLQSTARVVGAQLGELHFKVWMAIITLHVAAGMPQDGKVTTTIGELARIVWGDKERGGSNTKKLLKVIQDLRAASFTVPGYDLVNQRPADGYSLSSLLITVYVHPTMMSAYTGEHQLDRSAFGRELGRRDRGTIAWQLHPEYVERLARSDLRTFDWTKAQALRGIGLSLWLQFSSPRVPYRPCFGSSEGLEVVEVPLTPDHCYALGVRASADAARRRTLNDAGMRVLAVDSGFHEIAALGGRGKPSFLRVVRQARTQSPLERPVPAGAQLVLGN